MSNEINHTDETETAHEKDLGRREAHLLSPSHQMLENGVIRIARPFKNPTEAYVEAKDGEIPDYLASVDHSVAIEDKKVYEKELAAEEQRFNILVRRMKEAEKYLIVVLQGRDGAGKSGATLRIGGSLDFDAKIYLTVPVGPPTGDEREHPPLWRFFKHNRMPGFGEVRVFDRSWFEELLVVRVNKLKPDAVWQGAYAGTRTMDWMLEQGGGIVVKFWLDISRKEQKRRFKDRAKEKPWKLSESDKTENTKKKWGQYTEAANEMFHRTGTDYSPWFIISAENKRYSRVNVLRIINQQLEEALGPEKSKKGKKK